MSDVPSDRRQTATVVALLLVGILVTTTTLALHLCDYGGSRTASILLAFVGSLATFALVLALRRIGSPRLVTAFTLGTAILLRIGAFVYGDAAAFSDDIHRYVFEGRAMASGHDVFTMAPDSPIYDHMTERHRLGTVRERINQPELPAIYPPPAQILFGAVAWTDGGATSWRVLVTIFDFAAGFGILALLRRRNRPEADAALWFCHPFVVIESSVSAHLDVIAVAALVWGLYYLTTGRRSAAVLLFLASIGIKLVPIALGPLVLRLRRPLALLVGTLLLAATLLPWVVEREAAEVAKPTPFVTLATDMTDDSNPATRSDVERDDERIVLVRRYDGLAEVSKTIDGRLILSGAPGIDAIDPDPGFHRLVGRYTLVIADESAAPRVLPLEFDGSGGVSSPSVGRYWLETGGVFAFAFKDEHRVHRLRLSRDRHLLLPASANERLFGLKEPESRLFALRQYTSRWSANAPWILGLTRFLKKRAFPDDDGIVRARKLVQWMSAAVVVLALGLAFRRRVECLEGWFWVMLAMILTSATIHPWYVLFLLPFGIVLGSITTLAFSATVLFAYLGLEWIEYLPLVVVWVVDVVRRIRRMESADTSDESGP